MPFADISGLLLMWERILTRQIEEDVRKRERIFFHSFRLKQCAFNQSHDECPNLDQTHWMFSHCRSRTVNHLHHNHNLSNLSNSSHLCHCCRTRETMPETPDFLTANHHTPTLTVASITVPGDKHALFANALSSSGSMDAFWCGS